jgi:hypothetical protein
LDYTDMGSNHQVRRVHEKHGAAMYEAQLLEQYLGLAVLAATDVTGARFENQARIVLKRSMGDLVQRLESVIDVPPVLRNRLAAARRSRNWLVHRYFSSRSGLLQTRAGRRVMIRELDKMGAEFYQLWGVLDDAFLTWFARFEPNAESFADDLGSATREA